MNAHSSDLSHDRNGARVRSMFAEIAPRYDFLNHALSLNIDRSWRRFVVRKVAERLKQPDAIALDLCCGTADLSLQLGELTRTIGMDFCRPMLDLGAKKVNAASVPVQLIEGDALQVPFADSTFDVVTIAFGLRNLEDTQAGLQEIRRVLKPGGRAAVLEFSRPRVAGFRHLFQFYFTRVLPYIGRAISGSSLAYRYLPESVKSFPDQERLAAMMQAVGFREVRYYNLFGGVAALHVGDK